MGERKKFKVAVTEVLRKIVVVEATNEAEANSRVRDAYQNSEVILTAEDCDGAEFYVIGETSSAEGSAMVDAKPEEKEGGENNGNYEPCRK